VDLHGIGKIFLLAGAIAVVLGVALIFSDKIPFLGKLPGDINIKRENFQFYFPVSTSILVSVVLSLIFWIVSHFRGK
jgi:hypothetical protein